MTSDYGDINTNISNATSSLSSLINAKGVVKSVNSGFYNSYISNGSNKIGSFDINASKSIVVLCGDPGNGYNLTYYLTSIKLDNDGLYFMTSTQNVKINVYWQVIEFY